jgi:hypothetical protein
LQGFGSFGTPYARGTARRAALDARAKCALPPQPPVDRSSPPLGPERAQPRQRWHAVAVVDEIRLCTDAVRPLASAAYRLSWTVWLPHGSRPGRTSAAAVRKAIRSRFVDARPFCPSPHARLCPAHGGRVQDGSVRPPSDARCQVGVRPLSTRAARTPSRKSGVRMVVRVRASSAGAARRAYRRPRRGCGTAFAPALGRVRRPYPRLQVELITATRQLALRPSGFDPALVIGVPSSSRLVTEHLTDYTTSHWIRADHVSPPASRARSDCAVGRHRSRWGPSPMP